MGKGSKRRQQLVSNKDLDKNWERTFGKKRPKKKGTLEEYVESGGKVDPWLTANGYAPLAKP